MTAPTPAQAPRRRWRRGLAVVSAVLLAVGGYGVADAYDVVPGVLTLEPVPPQAEPFPEAGLPAPLAAPAVDGPDDASPVPDAGALDELVEAFEDDHRRTGSFGLVIADALTGEVLVDHDGDTARTPASSTKVLTGAAALATLGADSTLTTSAVLAGERLVLVGGGDVLLAEGAGDPAEVRGHAGLGDLAEQTAAALAAEGIDEIALGLDDTLFTGPEYHPDWETLDRDFVMPIQALAIDSGRAETATGYALDPALAAARAFVDALEDHDVEVTGLTRTAAPADAEVLAAVESAPVSAIVRHMLRLSDNSVAEALGRLVAGARGEEADFAGAARAVRQAVGELGADISEVTVSDTSGLDSATRVPPAVFVELLAAASDHPELRALHPGMPVSHLHGTLAARFPEAGAGSVRAKTGTLVVAVSLSGLVITDDGRPLLFSLIASNLEPGTAHQARLAIDDLLGAVASCGCRD